MGLVRLIPAYPHVEALVRLDYAKVLSGLGEKRRIARL